MTVNTDLIVLHVTKYAEKSLVVHTLSEEYGRRGFLVRSVGKKFPMSYFLPLNVLEAEITENPKSDLYSVKSLSVKHPLVSLRSNHYKNAITLFISEVLYRVVRDGTKEAGMFEWCEKEILLLDALETDFSNFHIRFLTELCSVLGFSPQGSDLEPFLGELTPLVEGFLNSSFEEAMLIPLSGTVRSDIAERLLKYIEYHCESTVNIKSLKVLHEVLQ